MEFDGCSSEKLSSGGVSPTDSKTDSDGGDTVAAGSSPVAFDSPGAAWTDSASLSPGRISSDSNGGERRMSMDGSSDEEGGTLMDQSADEEEAATTTTGSTTESSVQSLNANIEFRPVSERINLGIC